MDLDEAEGAAGAGDAQGPGVGASTQVAEAGSPKRRPETEKAGTSNWPGDDRQGAAEPPRTHGHDHGAPAEARQSPGH